MLPCVIVGHAPAAAALGRMRQVERCEPMMIIYLVAACSGNREADWRAEWLIIALDVISAPRAAVIFTSSKTETETKTAKKIGTTHFFCSSLNEGALRSH